MSRLMMNRCYRRAVTLMEVVFAMGVILIGLLGLLSILPLAGRRAQESVSLSVGPVIGQSVVNALESRRFLSNGRLRPIRRTNSTAVTNLTNTVAAPVGSYCIDPLFASSNTPPAMLENGYSAAFYPYYRPTHNPLVDPSTMSTTWTAMQPRLTRVGITRTGSAVALATLLSVSEALELVEAKDDLLVTRPTDRTQNARFSSSEVQTASTGLEYDKRLPQGELTWIATVNPLPDGQYASVSVVVFKRRDRNFDSPTGTTAPSTPEGNGVSERLAYVSFASGFSGGAGGVVHLVSNANTVSEVRSSDWVMLSRFIPAIGGGAVFHRWFRVVAVNGKPEQFTTDGSTTMDDTNLGCRLPAAGNSVWRHKVHLDGADWSFGFTGYGDNSFADNTYATIVTDVISVTERTVLINDL